MRLEIFLIPIVGSIIGWFTNFLAIRMVFNPKYPIKILFWELQGIFPKRKEEFAKKLGELIERELINHEDIEKACNNPDFYNTLSKHVEKTTREVLNSKISHLHLKVPSSIQERIVTIFAKAITGEVEGVIPQITQQALKEIRQRVDIKEMVREKITEFPMDKLEDLVFTIMKKELGFVEIIGGVLGFLIGCIQVAMIILIH